MLFRSVFQYHMKTKEMEILPPLKVARSSFAAHYDFGDRFIYIIGGADSSGQMIQNCEKFDIFNQVWHPMPSLKHSRGNPGTFMSNDKRYLYAFQGFVNRNDDHPGENALGQRN